MNEVKNAVSANVQARPLGQILATELSQDEMKAVYGGMMVSGGGCTDKGSYSAGCDNRCSTCDD